VNYLNEQYYEQQPNNNFFHRKIKHMKRTSKILEDGEEMVDEFLWG
jgi:hypothetical protein